jgi:hypothetical protein
LEKLVRLLVLFKKNIISAALPDAYSEFLTVPRITGW